MFAVQWSPSKKVKHRNAIWAVVEKQLTKEKTLVLCALNNAVIKELQDATVQGDTNVTRTGHTVSIVDMCTGRVKIMGEWQKTRKTDGLQL